MKKILTEVLFLVCKLLGDAKPTEIMMMLYQRMSGIPIELGGRTAIKLHMGDPGNRTHISPQDVGILVERIKANGGEPFLVDTPVLYPGARSTPEGYLKVARENGFGDFEVVISENYEKVRGVEVAKEIVEADSLLVLTHVTGHISMGFAGAIKNLGMGGVSRKEKRKIHAPMGPRHKRSKCTACGECVKACPFGFLQLVDDRLKLTLKDCPACGGCVKACTTGALWESSGARKKTFELLAHAARAVVSPFEGSDVAYVSVLKNITELCDCTKYTGRFVCRDIGYLTGKDPLEVDSRTVELIRAREPEALDFEAWEELETIAKKYWR